MYFIEMYSIECMSQGHWYRVKSPPPWLLAVHPSMHLSASPSMPQSLPPPPPLVSGAGSLLWWSGPLVARLIGLQLIRPGPRGRDKGVGSKGSDPPPLTDPPPPFPALIMSALPVGYHGNTPGQLGGWPASWSRSRSRGGRSQRGWGWC